MSALTAGSLLQLAAPLLIATVVVTASTSAQAQEFRFLCDGIDANGNPSGDGCGGCSASSAARWQPAVVPYSYDNTVPTAAGMTLSRWNNEIVTARDGWSNVSSLQLSDTGVDTAREFGVDNGDNSIFWVTTVQDWANQGLDQDSLNNALGVTITLNERCFNGGNGIFDADTVMNGVCDNTGACAFDWGSNSSLSTLTHEMGHGLGLGHPCIGCGALMSAVSSGGFSGCGDDVPDTCGDPLGPQQGDIQGIQQLYPAPGLLGSPCAGDGDCDSGDCLTVDGTSFCSQTCAGTCANGMICAPVGGADQCVFSSSGIAQVGDDCGPPGCVSECQGDAIGPGCNICLPISQTASQCFAGCNSQTGAGCDVNSQCGQLVDQNNNPIGTAGVCSPAGTALKGQACGSEVGCVNPFVCVLETQTSGFCRGTCDGTSGVGCDNTENCLALFGDGTAACFPHGDLGEGAACDDGSTGECGRGLLCIGAECTGLCSQGFTCPSPDDTCQASQGGLSFCVGGGGEGEGEGEGGPGEGEGEGPPPQGECRITRGNFDCPNPRDGCEVADDGDLLGTCTGTPGDTRTFNICEEDDDCTSGLCFNGVCTRPCDEGDCPGGYECDEDAAPAAEAGGQPGLCKPLSCKDDHGICDDSFQCVFNDTDHYTCAKDGDPVFCSCTSSSSSPAWSGLAALIGLGGVVGFGSRRRRR